MENHIIERVMQHAKKGGHIAIGRSHTGAIKIKVKHGPFNLFTSRYRTNPTTLDEILRLAGYPRMQRI